MSAVTSGAVDVNFTDDVGQTLLNWAAAFGTREMVEFLCEKGFNRVLFLLFVRSIDSVTGYNSTIQKKDITC